MIPIRICHRSLLFFHCSILSRNGASDKPGAIHISPRAVDSTNVRNEIYFALNNHKPFLAIHLEQTPLPLGLELRTGSIQAIIRWRMEQPAYEKKLVKTLPPRLAEPTSKQESHAEAWDQGTHALFALLVAGMSRVSI